jgi:predicted N-acetyltransferase YhbS
VITGRDLLREEIERVWNIDRSEVIDNVYHLENGALVLKPQHIDVRGWPPGEAEKYTPILLDCFDRGGWFHGLFDQAELVGAVVVDNRRI